MITHPSLSLLSHNLSHNSGLFSRTDLFTVVFCVVDDWMRDRYQSANRPRKHRGPRPTEIADSEVLTVLLVGELCQCPRESAWLRQVRASYRHLFPALPSDGRFSRRAKNVRHLLRDLRKSILFWADADLEPVRLLDSFPMPLCACYRIRQSTQPWMQPISGAEFGYNSSKKQFYFGLHPALLMTGSGYIEDIILAPGSCSDPHLLASYLAECQREGRDLSGQDWVMDKGFIGKALVQAAKEQEDVCLLVRERDYQKHWYQKQMPPVFWQCLLDKVRKPIEGVIGTLTECFGIEHMLARSDAGIDRRTQAKATAFSLARYFNQALGIEPMNIARYAV
jgi:hypothetical protein